MPYSHATRAVRAQSARPPSHGRMSHPSVLVALHDSGYRTEPGGWLVAATKRGLLKAAAASRETLSAGKGSPATGALPPSTSPRLDLAASRLSRTRSACTWVSPCGWCRGVMTVGAAGPKLKSKGFLFGGGAPSGCPAQVGAPAPWLAAGREAFCARTRSAASRDACARCSCSADGWGASAAGEGLRASPCAVRVPGWSNAAAIGVLGSQRPPGLVHCGDQAASLEREVLRERADLHEPSGASGRRWPALCSC